MGDDRSRGRIFLEDVLRVRVKGKKSIASNLPNTSGTKGDIVDLIDTMDGSQDLLGISNLADLQKFRQESSDNESRYRIYDEMETDSIIASALDMYADDATQYNREGNVIWAESSDSDIAAFANRLIDVLNINTNAWDHIRSLVKYGDLYLELFRDDETGDDIDPYDAEPVSGTSMVKSHNHKEGSVIQEYIEKASNPATIYELTRKGKTTGFVKTKEIDVNPTELHHSYQTIRIAEEDVVLPSDKYVHMYLPGNDRFPQEIALEINVGDETKVHKYKVQRGKSILHDIYKVYKELKLMEDSLLLNRVTRSSIIRILQVEVGDMPKSQSREVLKRLKHLIEQKNYMDKNAGTYESQASPGPIDNCIYVPTYNGKGGISSSNLGGDVDIKSIVDIEYFREKLSGGLKIPLSYISGTSQENGLGGGTSLTKIDARYARTIKRIQNAYIQGITNLINLYAFNKNLADHINNFTIKMVSPATAEDSERDEALSSKIDLVDAILGIVNNIEMSEDKKMQILTYLINSYLNEPEISDIINKEDPEEENPEDDPDNMDDESSGGFETGNTADLGSDMSDDFGGDGSEESGDEFGSDTDDGGFDAPAESDDTSTEEFGDFEDEYDEEF